MKANVKSKQQQLIHDGNCDKMINYQAHDLCACLALKTLSHRVEVSIQETASQLTDELPV